MCDTLVATQAESVVFLDTLPLTSETLSKRAERKAVTKAQNQHLLSLNSTLHRQYERTNVCAETIYLHEHSATGETKISTNYCGKRWCTVCSANKTAELMNGYKKSIESLTDIHFVTLTIPSTTADFLKPTIKYMISNFSRIKDKFRKRGMVISGIRKIECNYNSDANTFNPHFHLIIENRATAVELVDQWLTTVSGTVSDAQDIQLADENTLMELFKYTSKSVVNSEFDAIAQDTINRAFVGIRAFQPFGKVKKCPTNEPILLDDGEPVIDDTKTIQGNYRIVQSYYWNQFICNWCTSDGVILRQTVIRPKYKKLLHDVGYG
jgi:plasmid rolling circle replication initiator protein Rep